MENNVYTSSNGEIKPVANMHYEYLVNALSKSLREIFDSTDLSDFNKRLNNIQILERECDNRLNAFLEGKINDEGWL